MFWCLLIECIFLMVHNNRWAELDLFQLFPLDDWEDLWARLWRLYFWNVEKHFSYDWQEWRTQLVLYTGVFTDLNH